MNCRWIRQQIPSYAHGELGVGFRWIVRQHLASCTDCLDRYDSREPLTDALEELRGVSAPENLRTKILIALSHESERIWGRWKVRLKNWMRPLAIPATGGVVSAVILFVSLMSNFSFVPGNLEADVPLRFLTQGLVTHPSMTTPSPFGVTRNIGVEAFVDGQGYVYDFRIIRLPSKYPRPDSKLRVELANALLTARFDPATTFGRPVRGKVLLSFRPVIRVFVQG